uniref:Remorin C-terminal domain-containing protein n=1 Tax=Chenopodium quinoa TaxID=63459 RepID=A0A803M9P1_CHEQI
MDLTTPKYYQPTPIFAPSQMESEGKTKTNPFAEALLNSNNNAVDPICKLNLKETSDFVKSLPMNTSNGTQSAQRRRDYIIGNSMPRKMEAPSTPGRPIFSFSVARKSVPSKWDDAEKWLFNGGSGEKFRVIEEEKITKETVPKFINCSASAAATSMEDHHYYQKQQQQQQQLSSAITFNGVIIPADLPLKDKFTDEMSPYVTNFKYSEPTQEAFLFKSHKLDNNKAMTDACTEVIPYQEVKHRDFGTEMTPLGSSTTSRCPTPFKSTSPIRHNTPASRSGPLALMDQPTSTISMAQLQECHLAKLRIGSAQFDSVTTNWSTKEEEEEEISKSLRHFEIGRRSVSVSESRACAWEEEEKTKFCLRYQREEAKIQAWLNLQNAKAEAQSRKLEVKIQKMRSDLEEKLMRRMAIVHRKAEEWRVAAQLEHSEQTRKASERAQKLILSHHHHNSHLSPHIVSCGCFPCTSN